MTQKTITIALLLMFAKGMFAQTNEVKYKKLAFRNNAGYAVNLTSLKSGEITDFLIDYEDACFYWQFLSVEYFFKKNLGVSLTFQGDKYEQISPSRNVINRDLEEKYGNNYFVSVSPFDNIRSFAFNTNVYLGMVYAKRYERFSLFPKIQIGTATFNTNPANVHLKERNTNTQLHLTFSTNAKKPFSESLSIMTGILTEYKFTKKLSLDFNVQAYFFRTKFKYVEQIRNTFTEEKTTKEYDYNKFISTLSFGLGIGYKIIDQN